MIDLMAALGTVKIGSKLTPPVEEKRICPVHGEYVAQVIYDENGEEFGCSGCPDCIREQEENERLEEESRQKRRIANLCQECNIEPEFYYKTLADYIPGTPSQEKAKNAVEKLMQGELYKVVLLGANGLGKTMLASIAARELRGKIYTMYEISAMIRNSYTNKATKSELDIVYELASVPFLAIDEMGRSTGSNAELNWLSFILDKRHTRKLPLMLMSNRHLMRNCPRHGCPDCFENFIGNDSLSRLYEDSAVITIEGNDNRRKIKEIRRIV